MELRTIRRDERERVLDLLKEWLGDRAFFARYFRHDPTFRDDLCFVAVDGERIVSTLQVFRKQVRLRDAIVEVAAVGNVFTTETHREQGLASQLLQLAITAMQVQQFDLSLLFATRLKFYSEHGWTSHPRCLDFVVPDPAAEPRASSQYDVRSFAPDDLGAVMALYDEYNRTIVGSTVRDDAYWQGQLQYAGNPEASFLLAHSGGELVAYARGTGLYDVYVMMEHAYRPGHEAALEGLVHRFLQEQSGVLTQLSVAPAVLARLEGKAIVNRIEDYFWMWRVISPERVAAKLGIPKSQVESPDFLQQILPLGESVYWVSDRF